MKFFNSADPLAVSLTNAIHEGDVEALRRLLDTDPALADARIGNGGPNDASRTLLHIVTDWPGHLPAAVQSVRTLIEAGADVNARFIGTHTETPLHWAASSDDVEVLDALLDAGADIEAPGAVIGGGPPLADATAFAQWGTARRLVARGARTTIGDEAALGLMDRLEARFAADPPPSTDAVTHAFWFACHGDQRTAAEFLLARGADIDWLPGWERATPLDAALRGGARSLAAWLRSRGARTAAELAR